jgi:hypothetical protein
MEFARSPTLVPIAFLGQKIPCKNGGWSLSPNLVVKRSGKSQSMIPLVTTIQSYSKDGLIGPRSLSWKVWAGLLCLLAVFVKVIRGLLQTSSKMSSVTQEGSGGARAARRTLVLPMNWHVTLTSQEASLDFTFLIYKTGRWVR